MSFRSRMDAAYGRRGGRHLPWISPPRPALQSEQRLWGETNLLVIVVDRLSARRCRVLLPSGHTCIVADSLLEGERS